MRYAIVALFVLLYSAGCDRQATTPVPLAPPPAVVPIAPQPSASSEQQANLSVVLLGDDIRGSVAEELKSTDAFDLVVPKQGTEATALANADVVLLVTDALRGPLPVHRDHCSILQQLEFKSIGLLFANLKRMPDPTDPELLELEELEVRELLNSYKLPGDTATCFYDAKPNGTDAAQGIIVGIPAMQEWLKRQEQRARPREAK